MFIPDELFVFYIYIYIYIYIYQRHQRTPETVRWHLTNFTSSCSILCQAPKQLKERYCVLCKHDCEHIWLCFTTKFVTVMYNRNYSVCVVTELHRAWDLWKRMFDVLLCQHLAALIYIFVLCLIMMWMGSVQLKIYCEAECLLCFCQVFFLNTDWPLLNSRHEEDECCL